MKRRRLANPVGWGSHENGRQINFVRSLGQKDHRAQARVRGRIFHPQAGRLENYERQLSTETKLRQGPEVHA